MDIELERWEQELSKLRALVADETKRHLLKLAELRAEEARIEGEIVAARKRAKLVSRDPTLPRVNSVRTVSGMRGALDAYLPPAGRRAAGRTTTSEHPFPRKLQEHGIKIVQWAEKHHLTREKVKSWFAHGPSLRKIPLEYARAIEKEFGLPANRTTWPQGISGVDPRRSPKRAE